VAATTPTAAPTAAERGILRIAVIPWAEVEIDGTKVGVSPPLKPLSLLPGPHVVRLLHPKYEPYRRKVTVLTGETATVDIIDRIFHDFCIGK